MPTYEYACTSCGHRFDAVQSFSDPALTECPECGEGLRKVFGNVGIVLKGSGFYKTDSRNGSNGAKKETKKETESTASTGSSTKTASSGSKESSSSSSGSASGSGSSDSSGSSAKAAASTGS